MTRRMTSEEAVYLFEDAFETEPETIFAGIVEVTIWNTTVEQAQADIDSFLAWIAADVDPTSIEVKPDHCDEDDSPAARIIVRTQA
jgi:hypothetical protein